MRLIAWLLAAAIAAQASGVHPISGRRIAPVMGWQGAGWLERSERIEEEAPQDAVRVLRYRRARRSRTSAPARAT